MLRPFPPERMETYPVSKQVNDLSKDSVDLIRPLHQQSGRKWF